MIMYLDRQIQTLSTFYLYRASNNVFTLTALIFLYKIKILACIELTLALTRTPTLTPEDSQSD